MDEPLTLYSVLVRGTQLFFDRATYKEIDTWLDGLDLPNNPHRRWTRHTVNTLVGEEVTFMAVDVDYMEISTPEAREQDRAIARQIKQERGYEDDDGDA